MIHPLPPGTRVHHRAQIWSVGFTEEDRQANPTWGWATVIDVQRTASGEPRRYSDGSYEYNVRYDAPMFEGDKTESWWASYHIDEAEPVGEQAWA